MHQTGTLATTDCDCQVNGNPDCGVTVNEASNYSPSFNANGGGWYAMERTSSHTSLWFWERNGANVPSDVKNGASTVNPSNWGTPYSNFVNNKWNYGSSFGPENITTTSPCGDWAGNVYPSSCPKTCVDHVNQDPAYFQNASWNFANLKAYQ
ncbi:hypothetical protein FRB99_006853 [Tulasnella sp. 403]|nr:hypothetical protein FRB99_006853 [Tulasnella sp. 403]